MSDGSTPAPVIALRERFGDTKPPDITRKITACVACRKMKVKCQLRDPGQPCVRCKKRGLPCTVNKSLQMILESDATWKDTVNKRIRLLETTIERVTSHLALPAVHDGETINEDGNDDDGRDDSRAQGGMTPDSNARTDGHVLENFEIVMDPESGPAAIPGSVVSPVILPGIDSIRPSQDLIDRGVITLQQAQTYLDVYQNRLDHFLYRIIGDRMDLQQIRAASPVLLSAICAVGALHLAAPEFDKCYKEFISVTARQTFSRRNTIDDVKGLCVGAFWLSGISWTCIGVAVRIATEIGLHRSIFKALQGDRTHYLRTRLYYIVYVCDHHFSIAYGRPPMTRDCDSVRSSPSFLHTSHTVEDDARLVSQVQFWSVGSEIYDTFGIDVHHPLSPMIIDPLRRLAIKLDNIRADWTERFSHNQYVGNYPRKGVGLHYHFAKLYLYSTSLRGVGDPAFRPASIALDIDELANSALFSATTILRTVIADEEIQGYLNGLPTYFDVMIAFAVVFVLKASSPRYASLVRVDATEIHALVAVLITVLKRVTASMHARHLLVSVARGAEKLLQKCSGPGQRQELDQPLESTRRSMSGPSNAGVTLAEQSDVVAGRFFDVSGGDWSHATFDDNMFMGEFDFLASADGSWTGLSPSMFFNGS